MTHTNKTDILNQTPGEVRREAPPSINLQTVNEETGEPRQFLILQEGETLNLRIDNAEVPFRIAGVISEPGTTGEAVVYRVLDADDQEYALKVYRILSRDEEPNPVALKRIRKIGDADILRLYAYGMGPNRIMNAYCWELQAYARGGNLLSVPSLKQKYTPKFLEEVIVPQILNGIWTLHDDLIYHCDLKPQNIFYLDEGQNDIVIGDYGSAKTKEKGSGDSFITTHTIRGSRFYVPPEFFGSIVRDKSDYYSMGCILLELLYSELFAEDDVAAKDKIKLLQNNHEKLIDYNPDYQHLNSLIEGCTLNNWELRWGRKEVEEWQRGGSPAIVYRGMGMQTNEWKLTREKVLRTAEDFIDHVHSLTPDDFYTELIEDENTYNKMRTWLGDLLSSEDSKHIDTIRNTQGLKGRPQIREGILRYLVPELPLVCEGQSFDLAASDPYTAVRNYLIHTCKCLSNFNPVMAKEYVFQLEFALKQLLRTAKDDDPKIAHYTRILNIMSLIMENAGKVSAESDLEVGSISAIQLLGTTCDHQPDEKLLNLRLKLLGFLFEHHIDAVKSAQLPELITTIRQSLAESGLYTNLIELINATPKNSNLLKWSAQFLPANLSEIYSDLVNRLQSYDKQKQSLLLGYFWSGKHDEYSEQKIREKIKTLDTNYLGMSEDDLVNGLMDVQFEINFARATHLAESDFLTGLAKVYAPRASSLLDFFSLGWIGNLEALYTLVIKLAYMVNPNRGIRISGSLCLQSIGAYLRELLIGNCYYEADDPELQVFLEHQNRSDLLELGYNEFLWESIDLLEGNELTYSRYKDLELSSVKIDIRTGLVRVNGSLHPLLVVKNSKQADAEPQIFYQKKDQQLAYRELDLHIGYRRNSITADGNSLKNKEDVLWLEGEILQGTITPGTGGSSQGQRPNSTFSVCPAKLSAFATKRRLMLSREIEVYIGDWSKQFAKANEVALFHGLQWLIYAILLFVNLLALTGPRLFYHRFGILWVIISAVLWLMTTGIKVIPVKLRELSFAYIVVPYVIALFFSLSNTSEPYFPYLLKAQLAVTTIACLIAIVSMLHVYRKQSKLLKKAAFLPVVGILTALGCLSAIYVKDLGDNLFPSHFASQDSMIQMIEVEGGSYYFQGREVIISDFYIAEHETRYADFSRFVANTNYVTEAEEGDGSYVYTDQSLLGLFRTGGTWHADTASWRNNFFKKHTNQDPVVCVSFKDAATFCNWLSFWEGYDECYTIKGNKVTCNWDANGYRLPTEAEWEYAASGGKYSNNYQYAGSDNVNKVAWHPGNAKYRIHPVKRKKPNELGIYDLSGNVSEMCWDYYQEEPPKPGTKDPHGPKTGKYRCLRGGSWLYRNGMVYTKRVHNSFEDKPLQSASFVGFRVVRKM